MFTDIGNRFSRIGEQQHVLYYFSRGGKIPRLIPFPRMENPCLPEAHLPLPSARRQAPPTVRCWGGGAVFPFGCRLKGNAQLSRKLLLSQAVLSSFLRDKTTNFLHIQHNFPLLSPEIKPKAAFLSAVILSCPGPVCTNRRIESAPPDSTAD